MDHQKNNSADYPALAPELERKVGEVVDLLREARSILFITGAGISADSGIPTYRGIGGLYNDADTEEGIPIEEALSIFTMQRDPALTWKYILQVEAASRGATFNRAHEVLALMEKRFERVWVLTQNVDGFHRQAGSRNLIDLHGDLHLIFCIECDYQRTVEDYSGLSSCPECPDCGGLVRPDVVLFDELLPLNKVALMEAELSRGFDIVFSIGTTSVFPYISRPVIDAGRMNIPTIEVNPARTEVTHLVDIKLPMGSAAACQAIWESLQAK